MKLGLYIVATLIFILTIAGFTYYVNPSQFTIEAFSQSYTYPIFMWVAAPLVMLLVFTLLHILFYELKNHYAVKRWKDDAKSLEDAIYWAIVNEPKEHSYSNEEIRISAKVLNITSFDVEKELEGLSPRINSVIEVIKKIKSGEYVDLDANKMSTILNPGNPILIQNRLNGLSSDSHLLNSVMANPTRYSQAVQNQSLEIFAQKENFESAKKYVEQFNVSSFFTMLNRVTAEERLSLTPEILKIFLDTLNLECSDYIKVARVIKSVLTPEETLSVFDMLQNEEDKAKCAYIYLMFEYELMEQVSDYLDNEHDDAFMKFRVLYKIKKSHTVFNLEDILNINALC